MHAFFTGGCLPQHDIALRVPYMDHAVGVGSIRQGLAVRGHGETANVAFLIPAPPHFLPAGNVPGANGVIVASSRKECSPIRAENECFDGDLGSAKGTNPLSVGYVQELNTCR